MWLRAKLDACPHWEIIFATSAFDCFSAQCGFYNNNMADEDEDISILPGAQPAEIDLDDETQDFRFLDKLTYAVQMF